MKFMELRDPFAIVDGEGKILRIVEGAGSAKRLCDVLIKQGENVSFEKFIMPDFRYETLRMGQHVFSFKNDAPLNERYDIPIFVEFWRL